MDNAKKEFLEEIEGKILICAKIGVDREGYGRNPDWKILKPGYSKDDLEKFCKELDFEYDGGYGSQELFGVILFKDSYSERGEYDGREWWENHKMPTIREVLMFDTGRR